MKLTSTSTYLLICGVIGIFTAHQVLTAGVPLRWQEVLDRRTLHKALWARDQDNGNGNGNGNGDGESNQPAQNLINFPGEVGQSECEVGEKLVERDCNRSVFFINTLRLETICADHHLSFCTTF